jgi:galactokinase
LLEFEALFRKLPDVESAAHGRVNLIGEHTDYSGGFVMPMAIPQVTQVALARSEGRVVRVASESMNETQTFELGSERRRRSWIDYVQGTVVALRNRGFAIAGFDARVTSKVPVGSGLSSSAALEVSLLRALRDAFAIAVDDVAIAELGHEAETGFVGVPVGIMDQMASSLADQSTALFLDTRSLAYERVPLPDEVEVVVIDSGVPHDHATGGYATRRAECERAAQLLNVALLRDIVDVAEVARLPQPMARRARHVVTENARVLEAVTCMRNGDVGRLGSLFNESHASLRDDFEVTIPPVDRLVAIAQDDVDVLGARMTGGGFGGAIVALARRGRGGDVAGRVVATYGSPGRALIPEDS